MKILTTKDILTEKADTTYLEEGILKLDHKKREELYSRKWVAVEDIKEVVLKSKSKREILDLIKKTLRTKKVRE